MDLGSNPLRLSPFSSKVLCLWTLSCDFVPHNYVTLKWLSSLPILMQQSFWMWQCSDVYIIYLFPHLHTPSTPSTPSLMSLTVSVDIKHHVYLLAWYAQFLSERRWYNHRKERLRICSPETPVALRAGRFDRSCLMLSFSVFLGVGTSVSTDGAAWVFWRRDRRGRPFWCVIRIAMSWSVCVCVCVCRLALVKWSFNKDFAGVRYWC